MKKVLHFVYENTTIDLHGVQYVILKPSLHCCDLLRSVPDIDETDE